jgi:hypothetical protein
MRKTALIITIAFVYVVLAFNPALAKDEFNGFVQQMPEYGTMGEWVIGGRTVVVDAKTKIKEKRGKLQTGAYVEVEGRQKDGKFYSSEIRTKEKK